MTFNPMQRTKVEPPEDGVYPNAAELDYIQWDAVSFSRMKQFKQSAQHVWSYMTQPPKPKKAQELGSAMHMAILTPNLFEQEYFAAPGGDGRTTGVKRARREAEDNNPGKIGLSPDDWDSCRGARDAIWSRHAYATALFSGEGFNECAYIWTDPETKLRCKAKADRLTLCPDGVGAIVDFKSIVEASDRKIELAIRDFDYHIQGAHFIEGLNILKPAERRWILVFGEKSHPFAVRCKEVGFASMELGKRDRRRYLQQYRRCVDSGVWDAYEQGLEIVDVPEWEFREEEKREEATELMGDI